MGNIAVCMLQPGVSREPDIDHEVGEPVETGDPYKGKVDRCPYEKADRRDQTKVRTHHEFAERIRKQVAFAVFKGCTIPEVRGGEAMILATRCAEE